MHLNFIVSNFYKFKSFKKIEHLKDNVKKKIRKFDIKGTFLIGREGVNGSFSILKSQFKLIEKELNQLFNDKLIFKNQFYNAHAFLRLKVKLKNEIVTIGDKKVNPNILSGKHLTPKKWDELITKKDVMLIDTRNHYESEIGTFKNSIKVNSKNFREFPKWFDENKKRFSNKKIAMFCTGGIRCEKASNLVISKGYKQVYQLNGGIINYLDETKNRNNLWKGDCFVFDERVSINNELKKGDYSQCFACRTPISADDQKSKYFKEGVSCPKCYKDKNKKQVDRYQERQKQIEIAKKKGIKHLG